MSAREVRSWHRFEKCYGPFGYEKIVLQLAAIAHMIYSMSPYGDTEKKLDDFVVGPDKTLTAEELQERQVVDLGNFLAKFGGVSNKPQRTKAEKNDQAADQDNRGHDGESFRCENDVAVNNAAL